MKNFIRLTALVLSSTVTIHAQKAEPGWAKIAPLEARVVTGLPFSAEIVSESIQALADGNRIVQRTSGRVFRDGYGRVRREEDRPSDGPAISIMDPTTGVTITLDSVNRIARETPNGFSIEVKKMLQSLKELERKVEDARQELDNAAESMKKAEAAKVAAAKGAADGSGPYRSFVVGPNGKTAGFVVNKAGPGERLDEQTEERLQDRLIEGVWASGVRRTTTFARGAIGNEQPLKIVSEEWTSPDLQILVLTDRNDPRTGRSTYRLLRINRNDPDPTLFQVPPDYTVQRAGGRGGRGVPPVPPAGGRTGTGERGARGAGVGTER
jgi:hypothetical protein